jgi:hypothetical protein
MTYRYARWPNGRPTLHPEVDGWHHHWEPHPAHLKMKWKKWVFCSIFSVSSNTPHSTTSLPPDPPHTLLPYTPQLPPPHHTTTMRTNVHMVRSHPIPHLKPTNMTCRNTPRPNGQPVQHSRVWRCGERCPSAFNSFELPSWMLYQDVQLLWDSRLVRGESGYSL